MRNATEPADLTPAALLNDPGRVTVSVAQAAAILGIAKSTAHNAYRANGQLLDGVPVLRIGRRYVVSTSHLRAALGLPDPVQA
jgi:hypothetical protein